MSQIKVGAIISYIGLGINILIGFLYTPWMIHSIGRDNFGLYTLAMSLITLFLFDFGLSFAVTRFLSKYLAEKRQDAANNCLGLVAKLYLKIDVIIFIIFACIYFFIPYIYDTFTPEEIQKFKIIYCIAASYSVVSFPFIPVNSILTSSEKFIQLKLCDLGHKVITVITMTMCLLLGFGLYALVAVNAFSGLATILLKLFCIGRYTRTHPNFQYSNKSETHEIMIFSGWTSVIAICQRLIFNLAPTILGVMSGVAPIAILGIATTIEGYTYVFASALNGMFLPRVSNIMTKEKGNVLPLMIRVGRIQVFIIGLITLGFIFLGKDFINLWVGDSFSLSYICAVFLIIPSFFHLPQEIGATAIVAANKVKQQAIVFIVMGIINIVLAFPLAKIWGSIGISLSICVAYLIRTLGMNIIYHKSLHIHLTKFFIQTYGKLLTPLIVASVAGIGIVYFGETTGWGDFVVKGGIFTIIYMVSFWTIGFNPEERKMILSILKK